MKDNSHIFILGLSPRSGTNYLLKVLECHPKITSSKINGESFLNYYANYLDSYTESINRRWKDSWNNDILWIRKGLGDGLLQAIQNESQNEGYTVSKTPLTIGIGHIQRYFPRSKVIVLIRNGKNICASHNKTFKQGISKPAHIIKGGVQNIQNHAQGKNCLVIKYENLLSDTKSTIGEVLSFLSLEKSAYDFDAMEAIGVIGSSSFRPADNTIRWDIQVKKTKKFNPNLRSKNWNIFQKSRFDWIAGKANETLGYKRDKILFWNILFSPLHISLDLFFVLKIHLLIGYRLFQRVPGIYIDLYRKTIGG